MSQWKTVLYGRLLLWATKVGKATIRWRISGEAHIHECMRQGRPIVFAGWHGHNYLTLLSYYAYMHKVFKAVILVPNSPNGRIMAYFGRKAGMTVIQVGEEMGTIQWARATVGVIKEVRNGACALLAPDGPEGPAYEVKPGVAVIGRQTNAVIIPTSAAAHPGFKLRKRWDEHIVPWPFSRAALVIGEPIDTTPEDGSEPSTEELQARIKAALDEGNRRAEALCRSKAEWKGLDQAGDPGLPGGLD